MRIGFSYNPTKAGAEEVCRLSMETAASLGAEPVFVPAAEELEALRPEVLFTVGGDGSLLRYAVPAALLSIPILGINLGRVGFLTEVAREDVPEAIRKLLKGEYRLVRRRMLEVRRGEEAPLYALNDLTLFKKTFSGITALDLTVDGQDMGTVYCDGLIVATPTGSTAYSLSAGGAVLMEGTDALCITPVCPHSLHVRPVVAPSGAKIRLRAVEEAVLTVDGVRLCELSPADAVTVTGAERTCDFVRFTERDIFTLLRDKLV